MHIPTFHLPNFANKLASPTYSIDNRLYFSKSSNFFDISSSFTPSFTSTSNYLPSQHNDLISTMVLSSTLFYCLQLVGQRAFALCRLHTGRPSWMISSVGAIATSTLLLSSIKGGKYLNNYIKENRLDDKFLSALESGDLLSSIDSFNFNKFINKVSSFPSNLQIYFSNPIATFSESFSAFSSMKNEELFPWIRLLGFSLTSYIILEGGGGFRSAFPSSIISLGALSRPIYQKKYSVASSGVVTTKSERSAVQVIGKKHGCHHCGSRHLIRNRDKVFIADHMPPSKQALEMNRAWWRRLFRIKVRKFINYIIYLYNFQ